MEGLLYLKAIITILLRYINIYIIYIQYGFIAPLRFRACGFGHGREALEAYATLGAVASRQGSVGMPWSKGRSGARGRDKQFKARQDLDPGRVALPCPGPLNTRYFAGGMADYFEDRATSAANCMVDEFTCATRRMAS